MKTVASTLHNWIFLTLLAYERRMNNVDELKQRLIAVWDGMQQNVIDSAVDEWRKQLRACVCVCA